MSILEIKKNAKPLSSLLAGLKSESNTESLKAGQDLMAKVKESGLSFDDFLRFAVDLNGDEEGKKLAAAGLDGYEATLAYLGMPIKNDYSKKVSLAATDEIFQKYPGTRVLFPQVIDSVLRFSTRQDMLEKVDALVANSRTIAGTEMISIVADSDKDAEGTFLIAQGAEIPVRKIEMREQAVAFYKHGSGYEFTYEFNRRANIDMLTPYVSRINRRLELSKVALATLILINGDGVHAAAPVVKQKELATKVGATHKAGTIVYPALLAWLVDCAKKQVPVDTVVGNYDMFLQWILMFTPTLQNQSQAEALAKVGGPTLNTPALPGMFVPINFALSSTMPENELLGMVKGETLEELIEAGSQISESERAITSQKITYVKTETTGYRLVFGDTRSIYDVSDS